MAEKAPDKSRSKAARRAAWLETIGPVDDLESYVKADWWRNIFNANYLRTDGDVVEDPELTAAEVDCFLELLEPGADDMILDICCGQGRHALELVRRGFCNVSGIDRSHYLINRAKSLARKSNYAVRFKEGDARKLPFPADTFDVVYLAGNSFGYFESVSDDTAVLQETLRILKPNGQILIDFTDGQYLRTHYEPRSWEWIDKNHFVCRERSLSKDRDRLISREVIAHTRKGVLADQFYAERLYTADQLGELLAQNNFAIAELRSRDTESKRNQDLGMMARRIIITARARKAWTPARAEKMAVLKVAVLLGDPRIGDSVKPDHVFDEDDYHTINELKRALKALQGYSFKYFDNHHTLMRDLANHQDRFDLVLNLCDEGFVNQATKELHVPAILEALDLEYTGSGPQCLAYCYDKSLVRGIAREMDIPTPKAFSVAPDEIHFISLPLAFPVIVKPNFGDSSVGITKDSVCYTVEQLEEAILHVRETLGYDKPVLVEQFLGGKDLSVGIIGNPPETYTVLPIIEEDYSKLPEGLPKVCGYEAKWDPDSVYFRTVTSIPADIPDATKQFLVASCLKLFERLGCRDYARFDWRLDANGTPRLLEANPNPGWCWDGHLAKMAQLADIEYHQMLERIVQAARDRMINDRRRPADAVAA